MKRKLLGQILALFLIFGISQSLYANPIAGPPLEYIIVGYILIVLVAGIFTSLIEFGIAYQFLSNYVKKAKPLLKSFFLIHLISFPLTQFIAIDLLIAFRDQQTMYYAEIFPLIAEFFLLKWQLRHLHSKGVLNRPVPDGLIILVVFLMNLVTFVLGLIVIYTISPY